MTPKSGAIRPASMTQRVERRGERLAMCWIRGPVQTLQYDAKRLNAVVGTGPLVATRGDEPLESAACIDSSAVLVLVGPHPPAVVLEALFKAADAGRRVYVLASPGFGQGPERTEFERRRDARVLVRRLTDALPLSGLVANRGRTSQVWLGSQPADPFCWRMDLVARQGVDLFRLALYLFWHEALDEAWTGEGPLHFREPGERPFDALPPISTASVRLVGPVSSEPFPTYESWYAPDGAVPAVSSPARLVVVPPSGTGQPQLAALKRNGVRINWDDLGLPPFSVEQEKGIIEARTDRWRIRFALEPAQCDSLMRVVTHLATSSSWQFGVDVEMGGIKGDVQLPDAVKAEALQPEVFFDCGSAIADSLRVLEATPVPERPAAPPLALSVVYRWIVRPPHAPDKAKDDALVTQWRDIDNGFLDRIEKVRKRLAAIEQEEGVLARTFSSLASALLGLGGERKRIGAALGELAGRLPSQAGPEHAAACLRAVDEREKRVSVLEAGMQEERRRAEEAAEREKQEDAWQAAQAKAKTDMVKAREDHQKASDTLAGVEAELGKLSEQPRPEDRRQRKDLEAKKNKARDEQRRLVALIGHLDADIKRLESVVEKPFEYRPSKSAASASNKQSSGPAAFVPTHETKSPDHLPAEALPAVGRLLHHQGTRYLAISLWEELCQAECEAKRLNAQLIAAREKS